MKRNNKFSKFFFAASMFLLCGLQSCEDYLTITPTDRTTEEDFWQDQNDLSNVRTAAYAKLTEAGITSKILLWGEVRSDNLSLNKLDNTSVLRLKDAVLMPTEAMFDWSGFYTGINYCNLILERGQQMVETGIDPSFRESDWLPIKAEVQALRALYYFYLVKAFRDVPYVRTSVTTDEEAFKADIPSTPGVAIIGDLLDSLEVAQNYAGINLGSTANNKGRFTRRGVQTLMADMYLWRGCLLRNFFEKGDSVVNISDVVDTVAHTVVTIDGVNVDKSYTDALSQTCFSRARELCKAVRGDSQNPAEGTMLREYWTEKEKDASLSEEEKHPAYPLYTQPIMNAPGMKSDNVFSYVFGFGNSDESIFELQYDGVNVSNSTISTYLSYRENQVIKAAILTVDPSMAASATSETPDPDKGFGRTDMRIAETMLYSTSSSIYPYIKGSASSVFFDDMTNIAEDISYSARSSENYNWPIYRLSDLMLIEAEATARYYEGSASNNDIMDAIDEVNYLFKRCNPALYQVQNTELYAQRRVITPRTDDNYYGKNKSADDLLTLVYRERQREFVGEGKFWFDLVRQAEASNDPTTTLTDYMSISNSVKNRLKRLISLYNPIYSEELKVNSALVQNPVWDKYSKK